MDDSDDDFYRILTIEQVKKRFDDIFLFVINALKEANWDYATVDPEQLLNDLKSQKDVYEDTVCDYIDKLILEGYLIEEVNDE